MQPALYLYSTLAVFPKNPSVVCVILCMSKCSCHPSSHCGTGTVKRRCKNSVLSITLSRETSHPTPQPWNKCWPVRLDSVLLSSSQYYLTIVPPRQHVSNTPNSTLVETLAETIVDSSGKLAYVRHGGPLVSVNANLTAPWKLRILQKEV